MQFDQLKRRSFLASLAGAAAWPFVAHAQQPDQMRRLGMLMNRAADDPRGQVELAAFQQALQARSIGIGFGTDISYCTFSVTATATRASD
jgi:hypothetical protein